MPHDWTKVNHDDGSYSWMCDVCHYYWVQSKKPHPDFRVWYTFGNRGRRFLTCDEWIINQVDQS